MKVPLTLGQTELCVDPVPAGGGIINGCERLAFDSDHRPIISYHKLDDEGHMQVFVARFQGAAWRRHAVTTWDKNITFSGRGAMPFIGIRISGLKRVEPAMFSIEYKHRDYGSGRIVVDEETLRPVDREVVVPSVYPKELTTPTIAWEGVRVKIVEDLAVASEPDPKYLLRWETLDAHHDRPRRPPLPPATVLKLVTLKRQK